MQPHRWCHPWAHHQGPQLLAAAVEDPEIRYIRSQKVRAPLTTWVKLSGGRIDEVNDGVEQV